MVGGEKEEGFVMLRGGGEEYPSLLSLPQGERRLWLDLSAGREGEFFKRRTALFGG